METRELRKKLRLTQVKFWENIGVTQSAGSRYEGERITPEPVRVLVKLVYEMNDAQSANYLKKLREVASGNT